MISFGFIRYVLCAQTPSEILYNKQYNLRLFAINRQILSMLNGRNLWQPTLQIKKDDVGCWIRSPNVENLIFFSFLF